MEDKPYWFKARKYGWGWTPARRQGWLAAGMYAVLLAALPLWLLPGRGQDPGDTVRRVVCIMLITSLSFIFIGICYRTGEPPAAGQKHKKASRKDT